MKKKAASQSEANAATSEENAAESEENAEESAGSAGESAYDAKQAKQIVLEFAADIIAFQAELDSKVAKIRTIAGLDLQDDIPVEEIKEAMELLLVDDTSDIDKPVSTAQAEAIAQAVSDILGGATTYNTLKKITDWIVSLRGNVNGICNLDVNAKVPISSLPSEILNSLRYQSGWNANTNVPDLTIIQEKGFYYIVTAAGTRFGKDWEIGDWIVSNGVTWDPIDNTEKLLLGITSTTAGRGDYVKELYDFAQSAILDGPLKEQFESKIGITDFAWETGVIFDNTFYYDCSLRKNYKLTNATDITLNISNPVNGFKGEIISNKTLTLPANVKLSADFGYITLDTGLMYHYYFTLMELIIYLVEWQRKCNMRHYQTHMEIDSGSQINLTPVPYPPVNDKIRNLIFPQGKSTQVVTSRGKNLFDSDRITEQTVNGVTISYNSTTKEITLNGTSSANNGFIYNLLELIPVTAIVYKNKFWHVSGTYSGDVIYVTLRENGSPLINGAFNAVNYTDGPVYSTTGTAGTANQIWIQFGTDAVFTNLKFKVSIEAGTTAMTTFEPYIVNSPSPQYDSPNHIPYRMGYS